MVMKRLYFLVFAVFLASSSFSNTLDIFDQELKTAILGSGHLTADELQSVKMTNREFRDLLGPNSYLREHMFDITMNDGSSKTLREYLQEERAPITEVKNLTALLKDSPSTFIRLILKSIPYTLETIDSDLRTFHQETFQIDNLINSLPTYETAQQKLSGVLIELEIWTKVWDQVGAQVWAQVEDQVDEIVFSAQAGSRFRAQFGGQSKAQVEAQVRDQSKAQVGGQVWAQFGAQVGAQFGDQFGAQVGAQFGDQVNEDLRRFQFVSAFEAGNLNEVLIPAIDYVFTTYQLGTLAMRHSEAFKTIQTNFARSISEIITEEQAAAILSNLNIPDAPEGNYLIDAQLKLIKRLLPVSD